jgi:hypothetical protein
MVVLAAALLFGISAGEASGQSACARVKIEIEQRVVLTRTAFKATLKIENGLDSAIRDLVVALDIRDVDGTPSNDRFDNLDDPEIEGINPPDISGLGAIPGCTNPTNQCDHAPPCCPTGTVRWLIFPGDEAAPGLGVFPYDFGGSFSYTTGSTRVTIPMYPVRVEVMPDAKLFLEYYLQSPVYSDNPFTAVVEPAEPFSLGLLVKNASYGPAKNMRIISSQPKIEAPDRDHPGNLLLVAFQIIGSQLWSFGPDGVPINPPVNPSLTIDLGNVPPQSNVVARWLMTSTLQGKFINYSATFEHTNPLAAKITSLIRNVDIFELNHLVKMDRPGDDGFPDFLVDNKTTVDPGKPSGCAGDLCPAEYNGDCSRAIDDDVPDCVRASDGNVVPIRVLLSGSTDGSPSVNDLNVQLLVNATQTGWTFIRVDDPANGAYRLAQVVRPDGSTMLNDYNVWTTHRYLPIDAAPNRVEHRLYLFDYVNVPGLRAYTLMYEAGLEVVLPIRINDSTVLTQRSNITRVSVGFTQATNASKLIANGSIVDAVSVWKRGANGDPATKVGLTPQHYVWDPLTLTLTVDLTIDGAGGSNQTLLTDGNYELRLDAAMVKNSFETANLIDNDGTDDGMYVFGSSIKDNFYRFAGDGNADRHVDEADEALVQESWMLMMGESVYNPNADMNSDLVVNLTDLQLVRSNWNRSLMFDK